MLGIDPEPEASEADAVAKDAALADEVLDASDRPGATADTSAAKPAVSPAVARSTQRRVRRTRASAASRIRAARDVFGLMLGWRRFGLSMLRSVSGESVSAQ